MPDEYENLETDFAALLSVLEHVLSPSQVWELETYADYDEHELAFEMLCDMLRQARGTVPEPADDIFLELATHLGVAHALVQDLRRPKKTESP